MAEHTPNPVRTRSCGGRPRAPIGRPVRNVEHPLAAPPPRGDRPTRPLASFMKQRGCTMKKTTKLPVKLTLATETIRSLQNPELKHVAGGNITDHFCGNSRATICTM